MSHYCTGVIPPIKKTIGIISDLHLPKRTGKNAYELAKEQGFKGLLVNWNRHIRGIKGEQGDSGEQGLIGEKGYSAYDLDFISSKFCGTLDEWLYLHSDKYFIDKTIYLTNSFNTYWNTTNIDNNSSDRYTIQLPLVSEGNYDFIVDWGDGQESKVVLWNQGIHHYEVSGIYQVKIYGEIDGWCFTTKSDKNKLLCIEQWGQLKLGNSGKHFKDCINLEITAEDSLNLKATNNLYQTFKNCHNLKTISSLESWDWSEVNNLEECFMNCYKFNQSINNIDTSNLININKCFYNCYKFDQPLYFWEIKNLRTAKDFIVNSSFSNSNYAQTLFSWAEQSFIQSNVNINFSPAKFNTISQSAKEYLTNKYKWVIQDGGKS